MAKQRTAELRHEQALAAVSLAGIRPILEDTVTAASATNTDYTVADPRTHRVALCHAAAGALSIRGTVNATADASSFPILPEAYFVFDAEKGDTISLYNTTGGNITVYVVELY